MTCREKLAIEHPECIGKWLYGGCKNCPDTYGYLPTIHCVGAPSREKCTRCWNTEIPNK